MEKHKVSREKLHNIFKQLTDLNIVEQSELELCAHIVPAESNIRKERQLHRDPFDQFLFEQRGH